MEENKNEEAKKPAENNEQVKAEETNKATTKEEQKVEAKAEPKTEVKPEEKKEEKKTMDPEKKKKTIKIAVVAVIAIVIIAAVLIYFTVFHKKTIDLSKFIDVKYYTKTSDSYYYEDTDTTAYDGYSSAKVELDVDKLKDFLGSKKEAEKFIDKAELTVENDNKDNLSNGDTLQVKIKISSSYLDDQKLKLKDETVSFNVEGLEDANVLDLFAEGEFEVEVKGISPDLSVSVNNNSSNDFIKKHVSYSTDKYGDIKNGDTVTITAYYDKSAALEEGIIIAKDTYEYKIEKQPEYIDSVEELGATTLDALKAKFVEEVKDEIKYQDIYIMSSNYSEDVSSIDTYTTTEPELVATYLLTKKGSSYWSAENKVYAIYKVVYTMSTGVSHEWYYVANTSDVAIKDGTIYNIDDLNFDVSGRWDDGKTQDEAYNDLIDSNKGSYVIETVQ